VAAPPLHLDRADERALDDEQPERGAAALLRGGRLPRAGLDPEPCRDGAAPQQLDRVRVEPGEQIGVALKDADDVPPALEGRGRRPRRRSRAGPPLG
jgi:hypothetical protein